jgi:hypothetical protein
MDHHGFIHEKLDIKLLILFILSRLPAPVDRGTLDELCQQCDDGVGYFDYSDCLGELIATGSSTHCFTNTAGKPIALSKTHPDIHEILAAAVVPAEA